MIQYRRSAAGDSHGEAVVDRVGSDTGVVEAELIDGQGTSIAKTCGVYKSYLVSGTNPFVDFP
jgi:acyl-coenzyme A thioesterase PaaI-like protein